MYEPEESYVVGIFGGISVFGILAAFDWPAIWPATPPGKDGALLGSRAQALLH